MDKLPATAPATPTLDAEIAGSSTRSSPGHSDELVFEMVVTALRLATRRAPTAAT